MLELKEIRLTGTASLFADHVPDKSDQFENDQLRKLVNDELQRYGLLLKRNIVPKNRGWRTEANEHSLLGQLVKPASGGFATRQELCVGSFRDCCIKAARVLDDLDKSQESGT